MSIMDLFSPIRTLSELGGGRPFRPTIITLEAEHCKCGIPGERLTMAKINSKRDINKIVGNNIRIEREWRAIIRGELAEVLGITVAHMGLIEQGERGVHALNFAKLSEFFDIPVSDFFISKRKNGQTVFETTELKPHLDTIYTLAGSLDEQEMEYAAKLLRGIIAMRGDSD